MTEPIETAYIHIPFCKSKCYYCDFVSYAGYESRETEIETYADAVVREIGLVDEYYRQETACLRKPLRRVFFGGGTPSFISSHHIVRILDELHLRFGFAEDAEITIECNPGTVTVEKFLDYKNAGVNRISVGLQSASDRILRAIGRIHTFSEFEQCMKDADCAGLTNRNIDLMFGLPFQTMDDVREGIRQVLRHQAAHVSFYSLILEEGTPFYQKYHHHPELLPSEDLEREMYWSGVDELERNGFRHYEISNLARPGFFCGQNIAYWKSKEYFGFGAGAHSYQQSTRIENDSDIGSYVRRIQSFKGLSNAPAATDKVRLDETERELEYFMLGFRLLEGVDVMEFEKYFPSRIGTYKTRLENLVEKGYLASDHGIYRLTRHGIDYANRVFVEFV